jgi:hypothetical protein
MQRIRRSVTVGERSGVWCWTIGLAHDQLGKDLRLGRAPDRDVL